MTSDSNLYKSYSDSSLPKEASTKKAVGGSPKETSADGD